MGIELDISEDKFVKTIKDIDPNVPEEFISSGWAACRCWPKGHLKTNRVSYGYISIAWEWINGIHYLNITKIP